MDKVIVYLDDAAYARQRLAATGAPTHWILVACAPRMTHRISKWVSHAARENWRGKWAERLFEQVVPALEATGGRVTTVLARGPLPEVTRQLADEHGTARVVDVRRPKFEPGTGGDAGVRGVLNLLLGTTAAMVFAFD